jgi:peptidoglycan-associated lipoprotein
MKVTRFANILVIGLAFTIAVAASGCRKRPYATTVVPNSTTGLDANVPAGGKVGDTGSSDEGIKSADQMGGVPSANPMDFSGWKEDAETLKPQTVYFAFDSSAIRESEQSKIAAVANHLKENAAAALRVEGNCDERGTEEYNRSLGDRRAQAVREELVRLGIDPKKIVTVSYGEDRPAAQGNDENAWKLNRRDDFIVLTPP